MEFGFVYCNVQVSTGRMESFFQQLTKGNALLLITILGFGGSFQAGYHKTGLSSPSPYIQSFINSSWNDRYNEPPSPQKVTMIWSLIVSMYAIGGLFGAVSVKFFSRKLGRKRAIICNSMISVTGAVMMLTSKEAKSFEMIIVARMLYGYSSGLGMSLHLMYLGEISPRKIRGRLTLTSATFTSFGKLCGQFFGLSEILGRRDLWHVLLCVPVCFSVAQVLVLPFLPEAPRYLFLEKGDDKACKRALQRLWGKGDYKQEVEEMLIEQTALEASPPKSPLQLLKDQTVRWQLITIFIIYFCNRMSGMSAISTFSFDIFLKAGVPKDKIRYVTLGLGISEILTSISCDLSWVPYLTATLIFLFIVSFCGGPGAATATLSSELFIQSDRLAAFVLMGLHRWFIFAVLGLLLPFIIDALSSYCFMLFAGVCLLGSLYTFFLLPETKGKTLMDISKEFKAITVCGKSFLEEDKVETKL
ncbi:solute carrier family 2, facilitated glucose transporter member 9-like isoform X2 [Fundulus heteroclitus]|uniref:solute carrier family 2, facilitated glucose transporter member 9-like isoform X2 n=1 Tax=Fundulus heteroclitus TaxID=8078 RepID=UPI00165BC6D0|nr:solute carrier family 2, facilitated glucose transporter member 9-like isoform X2 [Fundulus heteroclitus]